METPLSAETPQITTTEKGNETWTGAEMQGEGED